MTSLLLLVISSIVLLNATYYWFISDLLERQAVKDMQQATRTIGQQMNAVVKEMDRISINIAFSRDLIQMLQDNETVSDGARRYNISLRIKNLLQQINELTFIARNIYIYATEGAIFDFGVNPLQSGIAYREGELDEVISGIDSANVKFQLIPPRPHPWETESGAIVFSLLRPLKHYDKALALIEIQQDYGKLEQLIESYAAPYEASVTVRNRNGTMIYPYSAAELADAIGEDVFTYSFESEYTGWTTSMSVLRKDLFSQVSAIRNAIVALSALIIIVFILVSFHISRRLSAPTLALRRSIQRMSLDSPVAAQSRYFGIVEIDDLYRSFLEMSKRLISSHEEIVAAGRREQQAYMKALQSQMNPHFLYNSLATIGMLADEIDAVTIRQFSWQLSGMLRYSMDQSKTEVTVAEEIDHVRNYLQMLEVRFEDSLHVRMDIHPDILDVAIPKLTLQPFVENAFIHGVNKVLPPWRIELICTFSADEWTISIADNGAGISDEQIRALFSAQQYDEESRLKVRYRESGGLGIPNTFTRLRSFYGMAFTMEIGRLQPNGCVVKLKYRRENPDV